MKLSIGQRVTLIGGRHFGRVEAIHNSSVVKIRWEDTGWIEFVSLYEIDRNRRYLELV